MHRRTYLAALATTLLALAFAGPASARTIQQDIDDAHAHWQSDVCGKQWNVIGDVTLSDRGHRGEATGLRHYHDGSWFIDRCEFSVRPDLKGCARYYTIAHEIGHFVHGPSHTGPMGAYGVGNVLCPISDSAGDEAWVKAATTVVQKKRTRAQIARSMRYKRQMAKIRARAARR